MGKNKIPIWENKKDYLPELDFMITLIIGISDRDYQLRVWYRAEGPEEFWYEECYLCFDYAVSYLKHLIRTKQIQLTKEQFKAILKTYVLFERFERILSDEEVPKDWSEEQLYVINHPYWARVGRQAEYALSLIKNPVKSIDNDSADKSNE